MYLFTHTEEILKTDKINRVRKRQIKRYVLKCDICFVEFRHINCGYSLKRGYHFCSKQCGDKAREKGGIIDRNFRETNLKRHGVETPFAMNNVKIASHTIETQAKREATCLELYGTTNPMQNDEVYSRYLQVIASTSSNFISKDEEKFDAFLIQELGIENFEFQKKLANRWLVDAYYVPKDLWIQFDGVHWHGLKHSFDKLTELAKTSTHFNHILLKYNSDIRQNKYVEKRGLRMLRVPFLSFEQCNKQKLIKDILSYSDAIKQLS